MTFEQALLEMKKGKEVMGGSFNYPLTIKDNCIVEVYEVYSYYGGKQYSIIETIDTYDIMRDNWKVVDD